MKKFTTIAIAIIMSISWMNSFSQVTVDGGFKLGADFSNLKWEAFGMSVNDSASTKRLITPRLGFFLDVELTENIFINTGVYGSAKGFRYDSERTIDNKDYDTKEYQILLTLDIPLNVGYKHDFGAVKVFGMLGPNLSYGLYATNLYKADGEYDNDHQSVGTTINDEFKPMNFGFNIEAGVELDRFQFSAYYTQGLSELSNIDWMSIKSNVIGINAAIKFGRVD